MKKLQTAIMDRRRGSTILLVLAMLSILLLLGIAFSYSTRLESQASFNYAKLAQARSSASSGLPMAVPMLAQASQGITSTLQSWSVAPQALESLTQSKGKSSPVTAAQMATLREAGIKLRHGKSGNLEAAPQAHIQIRDLSSLVNINAIDDETAMQRVVAAVLPGGDVQRKSAALMVLRGDESSLTGARSAKQAKDDNEPANLDPRDGNARMLDNLARLRIGSNSGKPMFSETEINKLATFVTVYSEAPEVYNGANDVHVPKIALDSANAKVIYDTLRQAFPNKKEDLLLQFAANVVDFSDDDDEPTILDSDGNPMDVPDGATLSSNVTIGIEMTPVISEVYPDAATSVSSDDDGQFVEISNPWNRTVSLVGWTLRTAGGSAVPLNVQMPPHGVLLVTDNFDTPKSDSEPGYGSVVSLFGVTQNGTTKQVVTRPTFNLPDRDSQVSLYNPDGKLADIFVYGNGSVDGKSSFQRPDPLVRGSKVAQATPLASSSGALANTTNMAVATKAWDNGNTTMTKVSQLYALSTGFVEHGETGAGLTNNQLVHGGQMAELNMPENFDANQNADQDPYPDNLDLRLIDIFTATRSPENIAAQVADAQDQDDSRSNKKTSYKAFRDKMERMRNRANGQDDEQETTNSTVYSFGKLNLNTCSKYALLGLNIDADPTAKNGVAGMIEQFEGFRLHKLQQDTAPFNNVSDFVSKFASQLSRNNLDQLDKITDQVTVGSSSFEITATNRLSEQEQKALEAKDSSEGQRPSTATAKWVISTDQAPYSIVSFSLFP